MSMSAVCSADDAAVTVIASAPHDPGAFTQGLLYYRGAFYESTGIRGASRLRRVDPATGRVLKQIQLPPDYFGEGLARVGKRLYWLTWQSGRAFVFDADTFEQLDTLQYTGEGWGLTWDGTHLIMSDGSATLQLIDPKDFSVTGRIHVTENGRPLSQLNELEYVDGSILANVWHTDRVVCIEPATGRVVAALDAAALKEHLPADAHRNVFNGIAWDARTRRLYVTGKYWSKLFQVGWPDMQQTCTNAE